MFLPVSTPALSALLLAALLCPAPTSAGRDDVRQPSPAARAVQGVGAEVFITDMEMARDDGAGRGGQVVRSFRTKDGPVHCLVTLSRAAEGTRVRFVWTAVEAGGKVNEVLATAEVVTRPREIVADGQLRHPREWPAGRYRVQAAVNGRSSRSLDFTIN
jgi:hypothetical protein